MLPSKFKWRSSMGKDLWMRGRRERICDCDPIVVLLEVQFGFQGSVVLEKQMKSNETWCHKHGDESGKNFEITLKPLSSEIHPTTWNISQQESSTYQKECGTHLTLRRCSSAGKFLRSEIWLVWISRVPFRKPNLTWKLNPSERVIPSWQRECWSQTTLQSTWL